MASTLGAFAVASGVLLVLGLLSGFIRNRLYLSEPLIALLVGVALGPAGTHMIDASSFGAEDPLIVLEYGALITLSLSVMGAALRLPKDYVQQHIGELAVVLAGGMLLMSLSSALIAWGLMSVSLPAALLLGAIVAPTDPVLTDSLVTGKRAEQLIPGRLRHSISAESGANDGFAVLLVMLMMLLTTQPAPAALGAWFGDVLVQQMLGGLLLGVVIGLPCGLILSKSCDHPASERMSLLTVGIALAFTVLAVSELLHLSGILASFAAGVVLNHYLCRREDVRQEHMQEAASRFLDLPIMMLFGAFLPWHDWQQLGPFGLAAALLILLLRRMPAWQLLWHLLPSVRSRREALFNGWFGPIGIAAIYYALMIREHDGPAFIWPLVSLVVCSSIVVHGVSATPFVQRFERFAGSSGREPTSV